MGNTILGANGNQGEYEIENKEPLIYSQLNKTN